MTKKTILFLLLSTVLTSASVYGEKLKDIKVSGVQRIEAEAVKDYLKIKQGDDIESSKVEESLKRLYETGWFSNVELDIKNSILHVKVVENPTVNQVAFEGNDSVSDDVLKAEIQIKSRQIFTQDAIKKEAQKILEIYQRKGRYAATVDPKIIKHDQNRVDVIFVIQEGTLTNIKKINFVGAQKFSQSELEDTVYSKEARWYRFLTATDTYDPERLETDKYALKRFYAKNGYINFTVISGGVELLPDKSGFIMTFMLSEGKRYKVKELSYDIRISGVDFDKVKIEDIPLKAGDWYDGDSVERIKLLVSDKLGDMGYAFVNVEHKIEEIPGTEEVKVIFNVQESAKIYIERIDIVGNTKTLDRVVRREMLVKEGDPFNLTRIRTSLRNIRNLGYFKPHAVREERARGSTPNKVVLKIFVEEESTVQLNLAAGYSTSDGREDFWKGIMGKIRFADTNIFGYGVEGKVEYNKTALSEQFNIGASDPHLFGYRVGGGAEVFKLYNDRLSLEGYIDKKIGLSSHIRYYLADNLFQKVTYSFYNQDIKVKGDKASRQVKDQAGEKNVSRAMLFTSYDKRDNAIDPSSGYAIGLTNDFSGLGGDVSFLMNEIKTAVHFPVSEKIVLNLRGRAGLIIPGVVFNDTLRITDHIMLGADTFHGFDTWGIGPRVKGTDKVKGDALGGTKYYTGAIEFAIPIGGPELGAKLLVYTEFGDLWDSGYTSTKDEVIYNESYVRISAGFGLAFTVPILGRIRLDYAWPIRKKDYDIEGNFCFGADVKF